MESNYNISLIIGINVFKFFKNISTTYFHELVARKLPCMSNAIHSIQVIETSFILHMKIIAFSVMSVRGDIYLHYKHPFS